MKNPIFRISIKQKLRKTSNENIDFKHGMYLTVTTLKNQILRINIKNIVWKLVMRIYILYCPAWLNRSHTARQMDQFG